jgi:hypothetical protein
LLAVTWKLLIPEENLDCCNRGNATLAARVFVGHLTHEASRWGNEVTCKGAKKKGEVVTQPLCLDEC